MADKKKDIKAREFSTDTLYKPNIVTIPDYFIMSTPKTTDVSYT